MYRTNYRHLINEIAVMLLPKHIKVKVNCPCALTEHHAMEVYWVSTGITPCILDLGTRGRRVVSYTPRLLYPQEKIPCYSLDRRLGGPQS